MWCAYVSGGCYEAPTTQELIANMAERGESGVQAVEWVNGEEYCKLSPFGLEHFNKMLERAVFNRPVDYIGGIDYEGRYENGSAA